jgi:hypothetical protein
MNTSSKHIIFNTTDLIHRSTLKQLEPIKDQQKPRCSKNNHTTHVNTKELVSESNTRQGLKQLHPRTAYDTNSDYEVQEELVNALLRDSFSAVGPPPRVLTAKTEIAVRSYMRFDRVPSLDVQA